MQGHKKFLTLIVADLCAECVSEKLSARVLLHTSFHLHYLKNLHFNTGMGAAQNFCPATTDHCSSCFSLLLLGLPFGGVACPAYLNFMVAQSRR